MCFIAVVFLCFVLGISAHEDCRFDKSDVEALDNSTVRIDCSWNSSAVKGSVGFIFGAIVYESNLPCHMKSERVLTISSATNKPKCPSFSIFEEWCKTHLLTNDTKVTEANNRTTASVQFPAQSLLEYNVSYNGTNANKPVILLYWMPQFEGQKVGTQCIVQVHGLDPRKSSIESNSTGTSISTGIVTPSPTEATMSTTSPTSEPTISTTRSKTEVASKGSIKENVLIAVPVVLLGVMLIGGVVWYCKRKGRCQSCCGQQRSLSSVLEDPVCHGQNNEVVSTAV